MVIDLRPGKRFPLTSSCPSSQADGWNEPPADQEKDLRHAQAAVTATCH